MTKDKDCHKRLIKQDNPKCSDSSQAPGETPSLNERIHFSVPIFNLELIRRMRKSTEVQEVY